MIINSKGKLFGKFSIIDIIIVLVVVLGVAGIGYKYSKANVGNPIFSKQEENIQISFYQPEVPDYVAKAVKIGDPVREALQGASFGTVSDIIIGESIAWVADENGKINKSSKDGYVSVTIKMDVKGQVSGSGVALDKSNYRVGETITLYAGNAAFYPIYSSGRLSDIKIKE